MIIDKQIAVITGAGSGLGEAAARRLAANGARVAVLDRSLDAARKVAADIDGLALGADVTDQAAVESAFAEIQSHWGEAPRIALNCAGVATAGRILPRGGDLPIADFEKTVRINLIGTYIVMSLAARGMAGAEPLDKDGARGVIINTASIAYEDGQIGQAAYAASKGGVASMTLPAARELARYGIRVMTIAPGLFETAMAAGLTPDFRVALEASLPFPSRMGYPDEYAMLVQQIIENPVLNGTVIRIDNAVRMAPK